MTDQPKLSMRDNLWRVLKRPIPARVTVGVFVLVLTLVVVGWVRSNPRRAATVLPPSDTLSADSTTTLSVGSTTTYTIPTYGISFQVPAGTFDQGTSTFSWQSGCSYSNSKSKYSDVSIFSGDSSNGGSVDIYIVCEPLASLLAKPSTLGSIGEGTTTGPSEAFVGSKKAYLFTTIFQAATTTLTEKKITVLTGLGTSTLDIVFSGSGSVSEHSLLTYPSFYQKVLRTFTLSPPVPSPQPAISPEAALALVEKRPGVQKWLAAFGGKVGGVDPRLGHVASIGITSETASAYTIEIAEITQTSIIADGWYSVDKKTGLVTNETN